MRRFCDAARLDCGLRLRDRTPDAPIALDQVPASIMKISQEKLPDVKFDRAVKRSDGSYEISGKDKKGKVRDVELTATGEVTEVE